MNHARPRVGVVGLGAMGSRLAVNLIADGYQVTVANRSHGPVGRLVEAGAAAAHSPAEVANRTDVVIVAVADDDAAETVWLDPGSGILAGGSDRTVGVEASTLSTNGIRRLADAAGKAGLRFLEAPMIGSRPQVEAHALVHLTAGPPDVLADVRPVLGVSAAQIHHVGDYGAAATLKLIVNALFATQVATTAELLGVARRAGLDLTAAIQILTALPVTSPATARALSLMTAGEYAPNFPVRLVAKDLRYLTALADQLAGRAPMSRAALSGYEDASAAGHAEDDIMAIASVY